MKKYELMLIVNPSIPDADRNTTLESIKTLVEKASGKVAKEDIWGEKKMAYKINGSEKGFYVLYNIEIDGNELKTITKEINLNKSVWRHMFVSRD